MKKCSGHPLNWKWNFQWTHRSFCWFCHAAAHMWRLGGHGSSVGCRSAWYADGCGYNLSWRLVTFFGGEWSWNNFYGHSLPSADSRRAVVSKIWWKNGHWVLVNCLGGLARNNGDRLTDRTRRAVKHQHNNMWRFRSICESRQFDEHFCSPHKEALGSWVPIEYRSDHRCIGWASSS